MFEFFEFLSFNFDGSRFNETTKKGNTGTENFKRLLQKKDFNLRDYSKFNHEKKFSKDFKGV